jgi:predicted site-specific integrase-resolvase
MSTFNSAQFAKQAGVSVKTLQRWDRAGRLKPAARTPGNRRLRTPEQLNQAHNCVSKTKPVTLATLRVSSQAQKPDLSNQRAALEQFCIARRIAEISGGLNFKRPKFSDLVDRIVRSELSTRVIAHKGRLARCGVGLLAHLCETHGCQIVVLNTESLSPKQELVQDWMTIVHSFSPRLYDLRSYHKAIQKAMRDDQGSQDPAQSIA